MIEALSVKFTRAQQATRSFVHDQIKHAESVALSYAVAAGLFASAAILLLAAVVVGITALFRWIEIKYGIFYAFSAVGMLLALTAAACVGLAVYRTPRPAKRIVPLASRLRIAIVSTPSSDEVSPAVAVANLTRKSGRGRDGTLKSAVILAVVASAWALARRSNRVE